MCSISVSLDLRPRGCEFESHSHRCVVSLSPWARHINPCLVLVQPKKTRTDVTERLLARAKHSFWIKPKKSGKALATLIECTGSSWAKKYNLIYINFAHLLFSVPQAPRLLINTQTNQITSEQHRLLEDSTAVTPTQKKYVSLDVPSRLHSAEPDSKGFGRLNSILGNFSCICCRLLTFLKINFSKNVSGITSGCRKPWIQIRSDRILGLIWIYTLQRSSTDNNIYCQQAELYVSDLKEFHKLHYKRQIFYKHI